MLGSLCSKCIRLTTHLPLLRRTRDCEIRGVESAGAEGWKHWHFYLFIEFHLCDGRSASALIFSSQIIPVKSLKRTHTHTHTRPEPGHMWALSLFTPRRMFVMKICCDKHFNLNQQFLMHLFRLTWTFACCQCNRGVLKSFPSYCEEKSRPIRFALLVMCQHTVNNSRLLVMATSGCCFYVWYWN